MRPTIQYKGKPPRPASVHLVGAPEPLGFLSFDELRYDAWNAEHPDHVVTAIGLNKRAALDDAMIKLACAGWKIRLRPALPAADLSLFNHRA